MRLINTQTLKLKEFTGTEIPHHYAILSHTWEDDEVALHDIPRILGEDGVALYDLDSSKVATQKKGFTKIKKTCDLAKENSIDYVWVDTCCIDKASSAELTEAINSMFSWYKNSAVCYAYLSDLDHDAESTELRRCRWFKRGWTLQELIAPNDVQFYDRDWHKRGTKLELADNISSATGISKEVLCNQSPLDTISVASRMSWAANRQTTREEDMAYCLLGIFDVNMPMLYGEGKRAFIRLQEEIIKQNNDLTLFAWQAILQATSSPKWRIFLQQAASTPEWRHAVEHATSVQEQRRIVEQATSIQEWRSFLGGATLSHDQTLILEQACSTQEWTRFLEQATSTQEWTRIIKQPFQEWTQFLEQRTSTGEPTRVFEHPTSTEEWKDILEEPLQKWMRFLTSTQELRGILAKSPAEFEYANDIIASHDKRFNPEFSMTNKGLRITPRLIKLPEGGQLMILNCYQKSVPDKRIGIYLTQSGPELYMRNNPQKLGYGTPGILGEAYPIYISKDINKSQPHTFHFQGHLDSKYYEYLSTYPESSWDRQQNLFFAGDPSSSTGYHVFMTSPALDVHRKGHFVVAFGIHHSSRPWVCIVDRESHPSIFDAIDKGDLKQLSKEGSTVQNKTLSVFLQKSNGHSFGFQTIRVSLQENYDEGELEYRVHMTISNPLTKFDDELFSVLGLGCIVTVSCTLTIVARYLFKI